MKNTFLSRFTPSMMSPEALEAIFVQRHQLVEELIDAIRTSALTANKHFRLLVGGRGMGKTHTIALIYHRIAAMADLRDKLLIAWLREEEWGVSSFLDLLLRIFRALEQAYPDEYKSKLKQKVEELYQFPEQAQYRAEKLLREFAGDRVLLLLMENLDDIFAGLGDIGQKQLRAYIQNNSFITILATTQSLFHGVTHKDSPFYGFFYPHHLEELSLEDAVTLLQHIAKLEEDKELESFIQSRAGHNRIKTIHYLAGGNHRVYVIFAEFLTRKSLDELVEPFMKTLDELTPYYQARMAWLSQQQRKIVEFLCDRRHPVPVKEIALRCFISHQTASSQLKDLRDKGYVRAETIGRESFYELREVLMRFCLEVKKQRGEPISLFVDFLRSWYTQDELQQRLERLSMKNAERQLECDYIKMALQEREEKKEDPRIAAYKREYQNCYDKENYEMALQNAEKLIGLRGDLEDWLCKGASLAFLHQWKETLAFCSQAIELYPNEQLFWTIQAWSLDKLQYYDEALSSWDKAIELTPADSRLWMFRGHELSNMQRYEEALSSYDCAIEINLNYSWAYSSRGFLLRKLQRYEEALAAFNKSIELGCIESLVFLECAIVLLELNRWDEGIQALNLLSDEDIKIMDIYLIIQKLFDSKHDASFWQNRIQTLIELYDNHQITSALGQGIVHNIPTLMSEMVSDKTARTWLEVWQELTGDRPEFQIPLRLLNAAVRYRETKGDRRVLLELPIEERNLLEPLLKQAESKPT
ncbi:MarR family transcriptional regulator [Pseudanabaena sp. PCC 6802]|uniref:MarR family transcriptional regulator n=1 Tax=Pseudanabaena sp. PCC 6802 TaxID=118173 RepID=UPI00034D1C78|nr:MarR family transcriptional regulator [Pseudanabaena sp. PCC 6802]